MRKFSWKRFLKYALLVWIFVTLISIIWLNRGLSSMYGGLTRQVNHQRFEPQSGPVAINNVNVLSPDGEKFIAGQTVTIDRGLIVSIDSIPKLPGQMPTIDGTEKYLIPGLIDSHVHLFKSPNDLLLYLANGVTEIREMIGEKPHLTWRKQMEEEGRIGPKMYIASPRMGTFGLFEGWFMSWSQGYINIKNANHAERTVKKLYEQGYDGVKIYSYLNKECYLAVNQTATGLGMDVVGHVPFDLELSDIWQSNQSEIAHFEELMNALNREFGGFSSTTADKFLEFVEQRSEALADNLIQNDIVVTSTLWLVESFVRQKFELHEVLREVELEYENPGISEGLKTAPRAIGWLPKFNRYRLPGGLTPEERQGQKTFWDAYAEACRILAANLSERGVKIVAGTDANIPPAVPGFSLHDELRSLNKAGMTTSQVLRSATSVAADWLKSNAGKIVPGRAANLVLLDKNPLDDIRHTKSIHTVIANGRTFDRSLLDQILAAVKEANDSSRKIDISEHIGQ